jgi:hypothetical protein
MREAMNAQSSIDAEQNDSELQLLYSVSASDIGGFKQHQWSVANHAILIQAALFGVTQLQGKKLVTWEFNALVVLLALTGVAALAILLLLQHAIGVRRERMRRVRASFGPPFNQAWKVEKLPDCTHLFIAGVVVASTVIFTWLVLRP